MAASDDLETLEEHVRYFLGKHTERSLEHPGSSYEFEVRFGRLLEKEGGTSFATDIPEERFRAALALARSVPWERIEEQEVTQHKKGARRVRIDAKSGAIVENVIKKPLSERTLSLPSFTYGLRFSLASETPYAGPDEDMSRWDLGKKARTSFVAGPISLDFTRAKARYGKERQIELEGRLSGTPSDEEVRAVAAGFVRIIAALDDVLGGR